MIVCSGRHQPAGYDSVLVGMGLQTGLVQEYLLVWSVRVLSY